MQEILQYIMPAIAITSLLAGLYYKIYVLPLKAKQRDILNKLDNHDKKIDDLEVQVARLETKVDYIKEKN